MGPRLPGEERFRRWLAASLGADEQARDRLRRRIAHGSGAFVLVYFVLPDDFFVVISKEVALLLALAAAFVLEGLRLGARVQLPTIRGYEADRPASFLFYSVALVIAVLLFPTAIAAAVVLGTAFVDPVAGELRARSQPPALQWSVPAALYAVLATVALAGVGRWPVLTALALGAAAAVVAVAVERWRFRWLDDDLTMTVVPAVMLYALGVLALGLPGW